MRLGYKETEIDGLYYKELTHLVKLFVDRNKISWFEEDLLYTQCIDILTKGFKFNSVILKGDTHYCINGYNIDLDKDICYIIMGNKVLSRYEYTYDSTSVNLNYISDLINKGYTNNEIMDLLSNCYWYLKDKNLLKLYSVNGGDLHIKWLDKDYYINLYSDGKVVDYTVDFSLLISQCDKDLSLSVVLPVCTELYVHNLNYKLLVCLYKGNMILRVGKFIGDDTIGEPIDICTLNSSNIDLHSAITIENKILEVDTGDKVYKVNLV